jgi:hypothetical protein
MPEPTSYIVHQSAGTYRVTRTSDGVNLPLAANRADVAIQTALDQGFLVDPTLGPGDIYLQAGDHLLPAGFPGFSIHSFTNLHMDARARLRVPSGFTGAVFTMRSDNGSHRLGVNNTIIDGGWIDEVSPVRGRWTAFALRGSSSHEAGMQFNKIRNTRVNNASVGVAVVVDGRGGYINSNTFEFLRLWACRNFVDFQQTLPATSYLHPPIWGNTFWDLQCQCQAGSASPVQTTIGINRIAGIHNTFAEVKVWDIQRAVAPARTALVSSNANRTLIIGGILAGAGTNFLDQGTGTKILDS